MLKANCQTEIALPQNHVWRYLEDFSNWADQVPGYQTHKKLSKMDSVWKLQGKAGALTKKLTLHVSITEMICPTSVHFRLHDSENHCFGNGSFQLASMSSCSSQLTCSMELKLTGITGKISATFIHSLLPSLLERFIKRITKPLTSTDSVALSL